MGDTAQTVGNIDLFGRTLLLVGLAAMIAAAVRPHRRPVGAFPTPAIFLVGAAAASDLVPALGDLAIVSVEQIVTVALALILFDGGMGIGRAQAAHGAGAGAHGGVLGTLLTAVAVAGLAHVLFRLVVDLVAAAGHGVGADRPGGRVLGAGQPGGRGPGRGHPGRRVGRQRPGRDRAAARPAGRGRRTGRGERSARSRLTFVLQMGRRRGRRRRGGLLLLTAMRRIALPGEGR
jgi:cell volume regulation protein A